jgi:predicted ATPase
MRTLALSGQRGAALAHYETCRRTLREELDVEPGEETQRLYEHIRSGDLAKAHPDLDRVSEDGSQPRLDEQIRDAAELRPLSATPAHNLPAELTPFVGRKALLSEIVAQLEDAGCRLLTLVGPGGSGKTRLARQAARVFLSRGAGTPFEDGLFFVHLAPLRSSESIVPAIASAIGFSFYEGGTPRQQLLDYLRHKQALIILDNVEHLLASPQSPQGERGGRVSSPQDESAPPPSTAEVASLVLELLRAASGVKVLATSRIGLNVRGEHLLPIEGMHYPESWPERAAELERYSAVQLFLASAREAVPGFEPTTEEMGQVIRICHFVEGMPLALLMAAAWMKMLTPAEIAGDLSAERSLDFLAADWRAVPERQRSMRAVFDHSWSLLGEREREIFAALSVFRGGFTREAAKEVAGASLRELMGLVSKSLLHRDAPSRNATSRGARYEMHELLRQYAEEQLDRSPDAGEAVRDRHAAHYAAALARWAADLRSERLPVALAEMDAEIENARAAWDWAAEHGQVAHLDRAMEDLGWFYWHRWRHQEGVAAFRKAAGELTTIRERSESAGESSASALSARVLIGALAWQSTFLRELGHREQGRQYLERARALLEGPDLAGQDVRWERARILWGMGFLETRHNLDRAIRLHEQSLALFQEIGDQRRVGTSLRTLGQFYGFSGQHEKGRQAVEESIAIFQALGDPYWSARSALYLAYSHFRQGQLERAEHWTRESLSRYRELGLRPDTTTALDVLGFILMYAGEYTEAQSLMEECQAIRSDLGPPWSWHFTVMGAIELHLGHYGRARALAEEGLAGVQDTDANRADIIWSLHVLGPATLVEGAHAEARQRLDACLALCEEEETQNRSALTHAYLGYVARAEGVVTQAWHHAYKALQIGAALGDPRPRTRALPLLALLLADRGEVARAVELYALASRHPHVGNSRWFEDVVGKQIAAAVAVLPPDLVVAAQERGQVRDLEATVEELLAELERDSPHSSH